MINATYLVAVEMPACVTEATTKTHVYNMKYRQAVCDCKLARTRIGDRITEYAEFDNLRDAKRCDLRLTRLRDTYSDRNLRHVSRLLLQQT